MKGFLAYVPAGFPNLETTGEVLQKLDDLPITGVEVGVPFSDPVADGPVIQNAHRVALENGVNLGKILDLLGKLNLRRGVYLMSYLNPILNFPGGLGKLEGFLKKTKIKGLIIPDLPACETGNVGLDFPTVLFLAPNSTAEEIEIVNRKKPPFVYYIARYGTTGVKKDVYGISKIRQIKRKVKRPLFVGFGISERRHVRRLWKVADGVIVGSALVKEMGGVQSKVAGRVFQKVKNLLV